jgi:transposase
MPRIDKYSLAQLKKDFPTEEVCLRFILQDRYPKGCPRCRHTLYPISGTKAFTCQNGHHVSPTAGTIFHKSKTPLTLWFYALFLMTKSKNGISAAELQRTIGVTNKTAWRMLHQIRWLMQQPSSRLTGQVEADETFVGAHKRGAWVGQGKRIVFGVVERQGRVKATIIPNVKSATLIPTIQRHVKKGTHIYTDYLNSYKYLSRYGYTHERINHSTHEYVRDNVHTNTIEGFWSQLKRGISGTHVHVSEQHLQAYVDERVWHYNRRFSSENLFYELLSAATSRPCGVKKRIDGERLRA